MELKDLIGILDSAASHQLNYWNIYWLVAIGILAFLWKEPRRKDLKVVLVTGFIAFCGANLVIIAKIQARLISLGNGINEYLDNKPSQIPSEFVDSLMTNITPMYQVVGFHLLVSGAFIVAMWFAKTTIDGDAESGPRD